MRLTTTRGDRATPAIADGGELRPAAPAARFEAGRVGEARHRNPGWLLAGLLLVLVSAIGGVLLLSSADDRRGVLIAAADIDMGQPLRRGDLRVVQMSAVAGVVTIRPGDVEALLGQVSVGRIPSGTVLNPAMFAETSPLGGDEMVFGAALEPGAAPLSSVTVGTRVRLLSTPRAAVSATVEPDAPAPLATAIGDGVVWGYESLGSGKVWVSVRTTTEVGLVASKAAQDEELRVVLVGDAMQTQDGAG